MWPSDVMDAAQQILPPIVASKFMIPAVDPSIVDRRLLTEAWEHASEAQIITISAGPGWGKSNAMAERLQTAAMPCAWLSLDPADNERQRFWAHLCFSIDAATGSSGRFQSMQQARSSGIDALLGSLESAGPLTIALDDLHHLGERTLVEQFGQFLAFLPTNVRLLIATRRLPKIGITRLRGQGRLARISESDLALTLEETRQLVGRAIPEADDLSAAHVFELTAGWPMGTQLALRSALDADDPEHHLLQLQPDDAETGEFLLEEVFQQLDAVIQQFVMDTSVLDRLIPSACAAITGRSDAGDLLLTLADAHCFVTEIAGATTEFRYHNMFRAFAQRQLELSGTDVIELRRRAARAAEQRDDPSAAIAHYVRAGDHEAAVRLLLPNLIEHLLVGDLTELWEWWVRAPAPSFSHPSLELSLLWVLELSKQDRLLEQHLGDLQERILTAHDQAFSHQGQINAVRAYHEYRLGRIESAHGLAESSLEMLDADAQGDSYIITSFVLARTSLLLGDIDRCEDIIATSPIDTRERPHHRPSVDILRAWLALHRDPEDALDAARQCRSGSALSSSWGNPIDILIVHGAALQANGMQHAAQRLYEDAVYQAQINTQPFMEVLALTHLAELHLELQDDDDTARALDRARRIIRKHGMSKTLAIRLDEIEQRLRARRALPTLTSREVEILELLPSHLTRAGMAELLYISPHTVHHHNKSLYRKLRVTNRDDAIRVGRQYGLIATAG